MTDEEIYAFCDANKDDIRCKCIHPDKSIIKIGEETRLPYYCWYEPCKRSDALLPAALKKNIARCNVSDCTISLGKVTVTDGILDVRNICGSNITSNESTAVRYLNQEINYPVINIKLLPIGLIMVAILILVLF
ncbi:late 16kDa putative membrane protein [Murmansk poxvirus]|uniref:Late 16kDa putative membrane protein n=1 Tax=Murmansk poxvirus TaxID=2025359 RepID=A0A223FMT0_9POXV|nr:late 16kDa putative membrane protein [Murmansk poxvirus]AST09288.1 late 16kDa putative membrane protein [Murmansk poxvirus]